MPSRSASKPIPMGLTRPRWECSFKKRCELALDYRAWQMPFKYKSRGLPSFFIHLPSRIPFKSRMKVAMPSMAMPTKTSRLLSTPTEEKTARKQGRRL